MNLYEIMLEHFSPKDSERGIFTYVAAESDEAVYEWLKTDPTLLDGRWITTCFADSERDEGDDYKNRMIELKGDLNDDEKELFDLYYGATLFGWKLVREDISQSEIEILKNCGVSIVEI